MNGSDRAPRATEIGRVSLRVADLDRMATFYESVVGLDRLRGSPDRVVLGAGDEPLVVLAAAPDAPERSREEAGLFHTAFLVPSREALGVALERIEAESTLTGASDHLVSEALYLRDPEGNGVEVYCDSPRSEWQEADGEVAIDSRPLDLADLRAHASRADATAADGVPAATTVGHVHLEVTDLASARSLFVDGVGMRVRQTWNESAAFVAAGDYHHHVGLNTWNDRTEPQRGRGLDWFEVRLPDAGALAATRERLRSAGYDVDEDTNGVRFDGMECRLVVGDGSV